MVSARLAEWVHYGMWKASYLSLNLCGSEHRIRATLSQTVVMLPVHTGSGHKKADTAPDAKRGEWRAIASE